MFYLSMMFLLLSAAAYFVGWAMITHRKRKALIASTPKQKEKEDYGAQLARERMWEKKAGLDRTFNRASYIALGVVAFSLLYSVLTSVYVTDAGKVRVVSLFGSPTGRIVEEGIAFINPVSTTTVWDIRRSNVDYLAERHMEVLTADNVMIRMEFSVPYMVNPQFTPQLQSRVGVGHKETLLYSVIESAIREAAASYSWSNISNADGGRSAFATDAHRMITDRVANDLTNAGFSPEEAESVYRILPVQVRAIVPPTRIAQSINERIAANEDLERQSILTLIAEQEAERRANEGTGVAMLFQALPEGYSADEIALILNAISTKTRADAMAKAVETGTITGLHLYGDVAPAASAR